MENENDILNPEAAVSADETEAAVPVEVRADVPADETAWTVLCELIGERMAAKFCRAFVRGRKVRITQRKFFMFADVIGAVAAKKVVDTFDGELTTLPEFPLTDKNKEIRDSAIRELRGKIPITTLSAVAGLSRRQIIRIQKGEKNERERI